MCEFCEKIWSSVSEYKENFSYSWEEGDAIVMYHGQPGLYVSCDDYYYSRVVMGINYCPRCGRELIEDDLDELD